MRKKTKIRNSVTRTQKQLYTNQANAIRKKLARRHAWAEEWSNKINEMQTEMKSMELTETSAITDLEFQLETTQTIKTETCSMVCLLEQEIAENHVKYKHKIAQLEMEKIDGAKKRTAQITILEQNEQDLRHFIVNETKLTNSLKKHRKQIVSRQKQHEENLEKIRQTRVNRIELLRKEIDQRVKNFAENYKKSIQMNDEIFVENAQLHELNNYISSKTHEFISQHFETKKCNEPEIQEKIKERKKSVESENTGFPNVPVLTTNTLKTTQGVQTDEIPIPVPIPEHARLKSIGKIITEAQALFLIPEGGLPEEFQLRGNDQRARYEKRRDFIIQRRQKLLKMILDVSKPRKPEETLEMSVKTPSRETSPELSERSTRSQSKSESPESSDSDSSLPRSSTSSYEIGLFDTWSIPSE